MKDIRPVYSTECRNKVVGFNDTLYFKVKFTDDCSICLCPHTDPHIIPCGHVFCKDCLVNAARTNHSFRNRCPHCLRVYTHQFKPCVFFYQEKEFRIGSGILLKLINSKQIQNADPKNIFATKYFIPNSGQSVDLVPPSSMGGMEFIGKKSMDKNNLEFYQSADGQLIFLDPLTTNKFKEKFYYVFGRIRRMVQFSGNTNYYKELDHIERTQNFYVIDIYV